MKKVVFSIFAILAMISFGLTNAHAKPNKSKTAVLYKVCIQHKVSAAGRVRVRNYLKKYKRARKAYMRSLRIAARQKAKARWSWKVAKKYKKRYTLYRLAKNKSSRCKRNGNKLVCVVRGRPCTYSRK